MPTNSLKIPSKPRQRPATKLTAYTSILGIDEVAPKMIIHAIKINNKAIEVMVAIILK